MMTAEAHEQVEDGDLPSTMRALEDAVIALVDEPLKMAGRTDCRDCQMALKEQAAARGERCRICLESFAELWPVQSESQPDLCRRCASAAPSGGRGNTYGRFDPLPASVSDEHRTSGGTTAEKPGGAA